jgi:DNA-directed RNA polymerase specialized sigma24 family protein
MNARHPLEDPRLAKIVRSVLRRGGVPSRDARDHVQTVFCKAIAAATPGIEKPEEWQALACKIAEHDAIDFLRRRSTDRKWCVGHIEEVDVVGARDPAPDALVEAKQQLGCVRQVLDVDAVHPLARPIAEAHALGDSREQIAERLGIARQTVTNILSAIRRAYARRWDVEKISWLLAWFMMVVIGMPAVVAHLHAKRDEADTSRDKQDAPAVSQRTEATWQQQKAAKLREEALQQCAEGGYVDCLVGLNEAKKLDPMGDAAPDVEEARRNAADALRRQETAPPNNGKKLDL